MIILLRYQALHDLQSHDLELPHCVVLRREEQGRAPFKRSTVTSAIGLEQINLSRTISQKNRNCGLRTSVTRICAGTRCFASRLNDIEWYKKVYFRVTLANLMDRTI